MSDGSDEEFTFEGNNNNGGRKGDHQSSTKKPPPNESPSSSPAQQATTAKKVARATQQNKAPPKYAEDDDDDDDSDDPPLVAKKNKNKAAKPMKKVKREQSYDDDDSDEEKPLKKKVKKAQSKDREDDDEYGDSKPKAKRKKDVKEELSGKKKKNRTGSMENATPVKVKSKNGGSGSGGTQSGSTTTGGKAKQLKQLDRAERLQYAMQSFLWWNAQDPPPGCQWVTMEHAGVSFPEPYEPHGVKMRYDGQDVTLTPLQEEAATFFAAMDPDGMHLGKSVGQIERRTLFCVSV